MTARPRHRGALRGAPLTPDVGVFGGGQAAVRPLGATEPDLHQLHLGAGEEAEAGGVGGHQAGRERDKKRGFRKNFITKRVVRHWDGLPRDVVEGFKRCLDAEIGDGV